MKSLFKFLYWTVFLLVVLVAVLLFAFGPIAKVAINHAAGPLLGVYAHVDDVSFSPVKGKLSMENFVVGNPEGFKTEYMMKLDHLLFDLDPATLFSNPLAIEKIEVTGFGVTLEGLMDNNISTFVENLSGGKGGKEKEEKKEEGKPEGEKKPARKVYIGSVDITETRFNFAPVAGKALPIPLPPIHLDEIGKPDDGASVMDAVKQIMTDILSAVLDAAKGSGKFIADAAGATVDTVGNAAGATADAAVAAAGATADAAVAAAGAVGDAAGATVDAVGDAAGAASAAADAVGDAVGGALGAIGGLFGGDK